MGVKLISTTSARLKEVIDNKKISQAELARQTGIDKSSISLYISGKYAPKGDKLYRLATALNVSAAWLSGFDVPQMPDNIIPATAMVPIYGSIPAGEPAFAEQNILGYMPTIVSNPKEHFCLKVKGKSMITAGITDGCTVLIHKQNCADDGQIVACRVNGDEATLKRFKQQGDTVLLLPENPDFDPRIVPVSSFADGEAEIIGVVRQIITEVR